MTHAHRSATQRAFTLVEVMVTLFIIGIGALGVAGLQLAAMRSNQSAFLRAQATLSAYALVDCMRAEPGAFVNVKLNTDEVLGGGLTGTDGDTDDADEPTPAETSFRAWAQELATLHLTAPEDQPLAELDCSDTNACNTGNCSIVIRWDDSRGEDEGLGPDARVDALAFQLCARVPQ